MAAVVSEVVTDATRLYHDTHSIMGGHAQGGSSTTAEHTFNRLNAPPSHRAAVPPSPRPQPTSTPPGTPPRATVQRATGESGGTPADSASRSSSTSSARPSVQRAATHGADSLRAAHGGKQQRTDIPEDSRRHHQRNDSAFSENPRAPCSASTPGASTQATPPPLTRAGLSLQDVRNHGGRRKNVIEVKSLDHIQSFANEEFLSKSRRGSRRTGTARDDSGVTTKYDISEMPVMDIIEMVAGLLTKMTTTNDRQHQSLHRNMHAHPSSSNSNPPSGERDGQGISLMTSSVLAFHGKNVPPITILSYLSRIHKYCPTTYDVFLSLLVYFDRMTERVNAEPLAELKRRAEVAHRRAMQSGHRRGRKDAEMEDESYHADEEDQLRERHAGYDDSEEDDEEDEDIADGEPSPPPTSDGGGPHTDVDHFFVVDGFNIHRLVIAGVTCASKFFSDVFYTNSRYAKVGGLPLNELNHLELQFLLLNDFRLSVSVEELEAYGTMLVEFYAREIVEQKRVEEGFYGGGGGEEGGGDDVVMME